MSRTIVFKLVNVLTCIVPALASDQIQAEIHRAVAVPYDVGDPDVAAFALTFDVQLINRGEKSVEVPESDGSSGSTRVAVLGVQSKQADGTWKYVVQSSWYDVGDIKYDSCRSLRSGETIMITQVKDRLILLKKQLLALGEEPTIRVSLMFLCQKPDGKVLTTNVTTRDFGLRLPASPSH